MKRPEIPAGLPDDIEAKKAAAKSWFEELRDRICAGLEAIEDDLTGPHASWAPGRFDRTEWLREDGRGGGGATRTHHRPLESYMNALGSLGLAIDGVREIPTYKAGEPGPRGKAERNSNREIPLFLGLRAVNR